MGGLCSMLEPSCTPYALTASQRAGCHALQGVRQGKADQGRYHGLMRTLLADVKRRAVSGQLLSSSVAGHLLNVRYISAVHVHPGRPAALPRMASACPSLFQQGCLRIFRRAALADCEEGQLLREASMLQGPPDREAPER